MRPQTDKTMAVCDSSHISELFMFLWLYSDIMGQLKQESDPVLQLIFFFLINTKEFLSKFH